MQGKSNVKKWLIALSVLLNIVVLIVAVTMMFYRGEMVRAMQASKIESRIDFFEQYPVSDHDIVFLGDSITANAQWNELFTGITVKNRGVAGDTTVNVLARLDQVIQGQPQKVFLLVGTNDLTHGPADRKASYQNYLTIVNRIINESPNTQLVLQSLMPRNKAYRQEIESFNAFIEGLAASKDLRYINLYPHFLSKQGELKEELTNDILHINGEGYRLWRSLLAPHVLSIGMSTSNPAAINRLKKDPLAEAFKHQQSNVQVMGKGVVDRLLPDDIDGSQHQRFILKLTSGQTLMVAHNIDLAPRVERLRAGDSVAFYGEYEWNSMGGVIHWTHKSGDHHSPHPGGWLKHQGKTYQ